MDRLLVYSGPFGMVEWGQDGWTFQVNQTADVSLARQVARYVSRHPLPTGHNGMVVVAHAGDGNHSYVAWRVGRVVSTASNYHHARSAVGMADSMAAVSTTR